MRSCGTTVTRLSDPSGAQPAAPGAWSLVFDDEFAGHALNRSNWTPCYPWGCTTSDRAPARSFAEQETYDPAACTVTRGHLVLRASVASGLPRPYGSCLVQTSGEETFHYGYFEARIRNPATADAWPAFWLVARPPSHAEIDVMESYRGGDVVTENFHWGPGNDKGGNAVVLPSATAGWNTYAVDWEPGRLTWYIDGTAVWQIQGPKVPSTPMFLVLNLALDSFVPTPGVPATMKVDYVRAWERVVDPAGPPAAARSGASGAPATPSSAGGPALRASRLLVPGMPAPAPTGR